MIYILTGLPKNKEDDLKVCQEFANYDGKKVICGSSTMKMYCRELSITPKINIINADNLPTVKYEINGIDLAKEGLITLNKYYEFLQGEKSSNKDVNELANMLILENDIKFMVGTAQNSDIKQYKNNNLLPRKEIINNIIKLLSNKKQVSIVYL